ncbi:Dihydrolipoyllysine-residue acetyltransferase component of acetoin cleaving system [Bienertia sinuspersici]
MKWDIFLDKEHFIEVVRDYSVQVGVDLIRVKVDSKRFTAVCANEDCPWRIHASVLPDGIFWSNKSLVSPHSCHSLEHNPMASIKWVASKVLDDVRANFEVPCKALVAAVLERFGVNVPLSTMYKARVEAIKQIQGAHDESYGMLPQYVTVIKEKNPDAFAFISWNNVGPEMPMTFKRLFISFGAQFKGFIKGCRPLIGIDGCHLKGHFNGCLLSTIALDANQQIFPVAYAVVSEESTDNWDYFFRSLRLTLQEAGRDDWTFMSDRMSVSKTISEKFAGPYFEAYFWQAADAYNEWVFNKAMQEMRKLDAAAYPYLMDIDLNMWARFKFDPKICCADNTNNFIESFNATLGLDRIRPIMGLMEAKRRSCMVRIATRQAASEEWQPDDITPYAKEVLRIASDESRCCILHMSGRGEWEVVEGRTAFPLNMNDRTCMCGGWQITGIPCRHACRVINNNRLEPIHFVSSYYSVANYKATYDLAIHPMPDPSQWPAPTALFIAPLK